MNRLLLSLCLCLAAVTNAYAGVKEGKITSVLAVATNPNKVFIKVDAPYQAEPACSAGVSQWDFVLDISTDTGKAIYAMALAAHLAGTTMNVVGTDTCALHANYETVVYMYTSG